LIVEFILGVNGGVPGEADERFSRRIGSVEQEAQVWVYVDD